MGSSPEHPTTLPDLPVRRHPRCDARGYPFGPRRAGGRAYARARACAGIAVTAGTYANVGAAAPARVGLSLVKAARKTGRLAAPVAEWMTRSVREAVDTKTLGVTLSKTS